MLHQGFALKTFIGEGYVSANEIAKILGISKAAVYGLFGNEKLDKKYIDMLIKSKMKIDGITTNLDLSNISNGQNGIHPANDSEINALKDKRIAQLEDQVQLQKEYIELLKRQVAKDAPLRKS